MRFPPIWCACFHGVGCQLYLCERCLAKLGCRTQPSRKLNSMPQSWWCCHLSPTSCLLVCEVCCFSILTFDQLCADGACKLKICPKWNPGMMVRAYDPGALRVVEQLLYLPLVGCTGGSSALQFWTGSGVNANLKNIDPELLDLLWVRLRWLFLNLIGRRERCRLRNRTFEILLKACRLYIGWKAMARVLILAVVHCLMCEFDCYYRLRTL